MLDKDKLGLPKARYNSQTHEDTTALILVILTLYSSSDVRAKSFSWSKWREPWLVILRWQKILLPGKVSDTWKRGET
jgi:hypothetical protein